MYKILRRRIVIASLVVMLLPFSVYAQPKELVVGQVAPFSGSQAVTGRAISAGVRLYLDHVNAEGGINGARIRLATRDDEQKPDKTVALARALVQEEAPVALIGTVGTSNIQALISDGVLTRNNVALVGPTSGASSVIAGRNVFVVRASYHDEVRRLFESLAGQGMKRVGLVYQDDGLGADVLAGAEAAAAAIGVELIARSGYERNTVQVEQSVEAMIEARPQAVFLGATTAAAIEFFRQYRSRGGDATIYGMSIIDTQQLLAKLGSPVARGFAFSVVLPMESQTALEVSREYLHLREKSKDADLSARSIEGFIAAKALVHALRTSAGATPTAASVLRTLQGTRGLDLGGYRLDFGEPGRSGSSYVDFAMFGSAGKIVR